MPAEGNGARATIFERVRRALREIDHAEAPALPAGEALPPIARAATAIGELDDRLLERRPTVDERLVS